MFDTLPFVKPQNRLQTAAAAPGPAPPALDVEAVGYSYGRRRALDAVTFSIEQGRFAVLLGLNGAGKTTLFSLISRLFTPQAGQIHIFGADIDREPGKALRHLGIVFQARTLDLDLSLQQNLSYHAALHGIGTKAARPRIEELLDLIGLNERRHDKVRSLSGGQVRRVEIVRALLHRPSLLLLDEATVGLDIKSRRAILDDIRELTRMQGVSVLWATHLIDEVEQTDQVLVLDRGLLIADGNVADIAARTATLSIDQAFSKLIGIAYADPTGIAP